MGYNYNIYTITPIWVCLAFLGKMMINYGISGYPVLKQVHINMATAGRQISQLCGKWRVYRMGLQQFVQSAKRFSKQARWSSDSCTLISTGQKYSSNCRDPTQKEKLFPGIDAVSMLISRFPLFFLAIFKGCYTEKWPGQNLSHASVKSAWLNLVSCSTCKVAFISVAQDLRSIGCFANQLKKPLDYVGLYWIILYTTKI